MPIFLETSIKKEVCVVALLNCALLLVLCGEVTHPQKRFPTHHEVFSLGVDLPWHIIS